MAEAEAERGAERGETGTGGGATRRTEQRWTLPCHAYLVNTMLIMMLVMGGVTTILLRRMAKTMASRMPRGSADMNSWSRRESEPTHSARQKERGRGVGDDHGVNQYDLIFYLRAFPIMDQRSVAMSINRKTDCMVSRWLKLISRPMMQLMRLAFAGRMGIVAIGRQRVPQATVAMQGEPWL